MKENEIVSLYNDHPVIKGLADSVSNPDIRRITATGIAGSSKALVLAGVFLKTQITHLVIIPEKEDAAYFYNDLAALTGDESVFFFPSTYKRSVQFEQTEPANIVLRTGVLSF